MKVIGNIYFQTEILRKDRNNDDLKEKKLE